MNEDPGASAAADGPVRTSHDQKVEGQLKIDSSDSPTDPSTSDTTLSHKQWERLSGQRDVMIKAMVKVFTWLNGGVFAFTFATWLVGIWYPDYRIVTDKTLMALIGATVVQAGIAFLAITRFLFPGQGKGSEEGH
jgi:hypothetical protein